MSFNLFSLESQTLIVKIVVPLLQAIRKTLQDIKPIFLEPRQCILSQPNIDIYGIKNTMTIYYYCLLLACDPKLSHYALFHCPLDQSFFSIGTHNSFTAL